VLDLSGGFDTVWQQRFKAATRSQVRKAERMGVVVETDTTGRLLPELHALLRTSVDRWARRQHEPARLAQARFARRDPPTKLQAIAERLGGSCRVSVARLDGHPVAAILVLQGRNAHYTRGAMDEELASHTQANRLLHKVAIAAACEAGCGTYHMGESGASAGLSQFKSRFGAVAHPYHEYFVERLPLHRLDQLARTAAKRVLGFHDD
jgi:lipid II:glycine glycyltransferase (peptidoglycan interpeptide bridge formation enzyme)